MRHETTLSFEYDTAESARRVERAIRPEVDDIADDRSRTDLERTEHRLAVVIEAADIVALRAALNTWLTLVRVAETVGARN